MSTVMRPRGPLPPQVYWTRRLLLVVVLVIMVALLWWALPGSGGGGNANADPGSSRQTPTGSGGTAGSPSTTGAKGPGQQTPSTQHQSTHPPTTPAQQHHSTPPHHSAPPSHQAPPPAKSTPTGTCNPATLSMSLVVDSAPVGHGTTVGLRLSTPNGTTCSLGITPSLLEARIISVPATIWQSRSCPDGLPAKNVVVRPQPRIVYSFGWDGQVNPDSCSATDRIAQPGGYWAEAALVGGEPHKTYFEVTSPSTPVRKS